MGFFQRINPFFWKAKAEELGRDIAVLEEAFDAVKGELDLKSEHNEKLKKTVETLSVQYEYPTQDDLCSGIRGNLVPISPIEIVGESQPHFTPTERKLLIDMKFIQQQNEYLESVINSLSDTAGCNVLEKFDVLNERIVDLTKQLQVAKNSVKFYQEQRSEERLEKTKLQLAYDELELKLERAIERAEKAEAKNNLWFEHVFGYKPDEMTILNRSFWGKELVLTEIPSGKKSD